MYRVIQLFSFTHGLEDIRDAPPARVVPAESGDDEAVPGADGGGGEADGADPGGERHGGGQA